MHSFFIYYAQAFRIATTGNSALHQQLEVRRQSDTSIDMYIGCYRMPSTPPSSTIRPCTSNWRCAAVLPALQLLRAAAGREKWIAALRLLRAAADRQRWIAEPFACRMCSMAD